jgi:hypothetical protein
MRQDRRDSDISRPRSLWGLDLSLCLQRLLEFRAERDWEQFHRPKELASALAIESGELQELFPGVIPRRRRTSHGAIPRACRRYGKKPPTY